MSCLSVLNLAVHPSLTWQDAFGYPGDASIEARSKNPCSLQEHNWLFWNNVANFAGYFLGPLIGLIRIAANAILLTRGRNFSDDNPKNVFSDQTKLYLKVQIGRGCFEVIGGGSFLWMGDLFVLIAQSIQDAQSRNQQSST